MRELWYGFLGAVMLALFLLPGFISVDTMLYRVFIAICATMWLMSITAEMFYDLGRME